VAVAAVLSFSLAMAAGAGSEQRRLPGCPERSVCLWKTPTPSEDDKRYSVKGTGITNLPDGFNNKVSIAYNNRGRIAILYAGRNGNGDSHCVAANDSSGNLADVAFDNRTSSVRLHKTSTKC
jgi:hypothetical protein